MPLRTTSIILALGVLVTGAALLHTLSADQPNQPARVDPTVPLDHPTVSLAPQPTSTDYPTCADQQTDNQKTDQNLGPCYPPTPTPTSTPTDHLPICPTAPPTSNALPCLPATATPTPAIPPCDQQTEGLCVYTKPTQSPPTIPICPTTTHSTFYDADICYQQPPSPVPEHLT